VSARTIVTIVAIVFIGGFTFLTVAAAIDEGITLGTVISLAVLVLLGVGILGALSSRGPGDDER
jgi:VIT1/CCC1 family predicted Fe2+/Mn2+ transporter